MNNDGAPTVGNDQAQLVNFRVAIVVLLGTAAIYRYVQKQRRDEADKRFGAENHCLPAQQRLPYKWPLALDLFKMQYDAMKSGHLLEAQSEFFRKHAMGKTYEVKLLGRVGLFTTDPVNIHAILITNFDGQKLSPFVFGSTLTQYLDIDFGLGSRRPGFYPMIGEGIFTQDGEPWKHSRETLRRQFVRMQYQDLRLFEGPINTLLSELRSLPSGVVDLQPYFFRFTLTTTTSLIFGEPFAGLDSTDHENFSANFNYSGLVTAMRIRLADWCWLYTPPKFMKSNSALKQYAMRYVNHALEDLKENGAEEAIERHPFIIDLYQGLRDPILVRDQLMNVLLAGRDTTACLMSWTLHLLLRHPNALARLRQEITATSAGETRLTRAHIAKMTYLKNVLNETNRVYAIVPVNVRQATKTTTIPRGGGPDGLSPLLVPKGKGIGFSPYHMHRDPDTYGEDADKFRPERWEGDELKNVGLGFIPFHAGPRVCLGKDFALMEASYGIVRILQTFPDIHLPKGWPVQPPGQEQQRIALVLSNGDGCQVVLNEAEIS